MSTFVRVSATAARRIKDLASDRGVSCEHVIDELLDAKEDDAPTHLCMKGERYMLIHASYRTVCPGCMLKTYRGDAIAWRPGRCAWHVDCFRREQRRLSGPWKDISLFP